MMLRLQDDKAAGSAAAEITRRSRTLRIVSEAENQADLADKAEHGVHHIGVLQSSGVPHNAAAPVGDPAAAAMDHSMVQHPKSTLCLALPRSD